MEFIRNEKYPEALNNFLEELAINEKSQNTIDSYGRWIENFIKFQKSVKYRNSEENIDDIDISDVTNNLYKKIDISSCKKYKKYLTEKIYKGKKYSGSTVNNYLAACRSFFKYLVEEEEILESNVLLNVKDIDERKRVIDYLTIEEANKLLDHIKNKNTIYTKRDYMIVNLMLNTGMRIDELYKLNVNTINFSSNTIKVLGKGNKEREIPISKKCIDSIKEYLKIRTEFIKDDVEQNALFISKQENRLCKSTVKSNIKKYGDEIGIKAHAHKLRHTAASIMIQNGVPLEIIREILGHENIATTTIYAKINNKQKQEAVNVLADMFD